MSTKDTMNLKLKLSCITMLGTAFLTAFTQPHSLSAAEATSEKEPPSLSQESLQELLELAREVLGPLPDKMPGAEKDTPAKVQLGKKLYFDTNLSANRTQSCNTCHRVDENLGGVDNASTSLGAFGERGGRNSPTVLNAGFQVAQFWDGRAEDLAAQAKGPVLNPIEMAMPNEDAVLKRIKEDPSYADLFCQSFSGSGEKITYDNVAQAIAAFERTLITKDRFDDFLKGQKQALSQKEIRGLDKFMKLGCVSCHTGPLIGGNTFQKVGLIHPYENFNDLGRYDVTKDEDDKYKFKVPTLRNIAITGPYMHDGSVATLEGMVRKMAWLQLGLQISEADTSDIVAFLKTLTDKERVKN